MLTRSRTMAAPEAAGESKNGEG